MTLESTYITADAVAAHEAKFPAVEPVAPVTLPSEYEVLYNEAKAENTRLSTIIASAKINTASSHQSDKPAVSAERVKALLGPVGLLKLSREEKLKSLGVDPATSDDLLRRLFGRNNDGKTGPDLMKTNAKNYFLLREAAKILNIYAT